MIRINFDLSRKWNSKMLPSIILALYVLSQLQILHVNPSTGYDYVYLDTADM